MATLPRLYSKETHVRTLLPNDTTMIRTVLCVVLLGALVGASGCASTPAPTADLTQAQTLVDQAEQSGATQYAGEDLASARSKLQLADQDAQRHPEYSIWMAQEASADARVAMARTNAVKAQMALNDVDAGTQTLRIETDRAQLSPPLPATVTAPTQQ
jgi:Domain of unknown function (DUF4398)